VKAFIKEFQRRHTFNSEDQETIRIKFPNTLFKDIPDAWILLLDKFLTLVYADEPRAVSSVKQKCGFFHVTFRNGFGSKFADLASRIEDKLYIIDKDLHEQVDYENRIRAVARRNELEI
jgi:hypothetical protein